MSLILNLASVHHFMIIVTLIWLTVKSRICSQYDALLALTPPKSNENDNQRGMW
jgi:hypothetical protein